MKSIVSIVVVLLSFAFPRQGWAGQFMVDDVHFYYPNPDPGSTRLYVAVGSSAVFEGVVEPGDDHWAIEANLIVAGQTYWASTVGGSGITPAMRITCPDTSCGGFHEFNKCPETSYGGYGIAAVYDISSPKTDRRDLQSISTYCPEGTGEEPSGGNDDPTGGKNNCDVYCTPLVIDVDGGGFRFTDLENGVDFDLNPGGTVEHVSWTSGGGDAFLALDRNGNGGIDNGRELFGNASAQRHSRTPNGFEALAVFDEPAQGGNADDWITAGDAVFPLLRLWFDWNHNGVSEPPELVPLSQVGVRGLNLAYRESRRQDRYGNQLRYRSEVQLERGVTSVADVFLKTR